MFLQERQTAILKEQIGRTVQHAGVAITVTSLTDMLAFAIGSTTVSAVYFKISKFSKMVLNLNDLKRNFI